MLYGERAAIFMLCEVRSLGLTGVAGYEVRAECDLSGGLPAFDIVGLPDAAVKEARERVRAAVKNCGFTFPVSRITVNLAPAAQRKAGTLYDLPILVGILAAGGQLRCDPTSSSVRISITVVISWLTRNFLSLSLAYPCLSLLRTEKLFVFLPYYNGYFD